MMTAINQRISGVEVRKHQGQVRLQVMPITGKSHRKPDYRLLEDEILEGVEVTEVDESGQVPILKVKNTLDQRVFLMDGQELVGAKQNRILNTDVMVPAKTTLKIPVSCVEQGRWDNSSTKFSPGKSASFCVRRGKHQRVHESLKDRKKFDAGQCEVWDDVKFSVGISQSVSGTEALHDAYTNREQELKQVRDEFKLRPVRKLSVA